MARSVFILGGSSSGKSQYAENMAASLEKETGFQVYYLATARVIDDELAGRVKRHRQRRPPSWSTIEEPIDLAGTVRNLNGKPVICLVDGVGTWVSNIIIESLEAAGIWNACQEAQCLDPIYDFIRSWEEMNGVIIMVADEVGWDLMPEYELGRIFVELNGQVNQILASAAGDMFFVASGTPICMKGGISI